MLLFTVLSAYDIYCCIFLFCLHIFMFSKLNVISSQTNLTSEKVHAFLGNELV